VVDLPEARVFHCRSLAQHQERSHQHRVGQVLRDLPQRLKKTKKKKEKDVRGCSKTKPKHKHTKPQNKKKFKKRRKKKKKMFS
jgi:hypothetical protein